VPDYNPNTAGVGQARTAYGWATAAEPRVAARTQLLNLLSYADN